MSKLITRLQRESPRSRNFCNRLQTACKPEATSIHKTDGSSGMQIRESLVSSVLEHKKYLFNFESLLNSGDVRNHKLKRAQYLQQANAKMKAELAKMPAQTNEPHQSGAERKGAALDGEVKIGGKEVFSRC